MTTRAKLRVAVVYHFWPHYRAAVVTALDASTQVSYTFFGSGKPCEGIKHMEPNQFRRFVYAPFYVLGGIVWQPKAIRLAFSGDFDVIIFLADIHFASTWVAAMMARARGKPVLFWAHGWLRKESGAKRRIRNTYYRLANRMMLYAERGRQLGAASGYPADRIDVIYNSLDVDRADALVARIEAGLLALLQPQSFFANPERPLAICTARLTSLCRFDLLLKAAALMRERGTELNILLVGEGPARLDLERLAADLGLAVHFFGACYDEEITGQLIYHSDLTVSPGKIGLTAMHTLMYGTPAITHDDLDHQMPEVEALTDGVTGALFRHDDVESLASTIDKWLKAGHDRAVVRAACRAAVHNRWNPNVQAKLIESTVLGAVNRFKYNHDKVGF